MSASKFNTEQRNGIYRSRDGVFFGVCLGVSEYFDFSVVGIRMVLIVLCFASGLVPVILMYILAALLMKPKPVMPFRSDNDHEFYNSYLHSREMALLRLKKKYEALNRKIQRLEDHVTSREFDWENRFNKQ
jgi:phage shock protein C